MPYRSAKTGAMTDAQTVACHGLIEAVRGRCQNQSGGKTMRKILATIAAMLAIAVVMATSAGPAKTGAVDDEIDAVSYANASFRGKR
jgi:hypothetical protein